MNSIATTPADNSTFARTTFRTSRDMDFLTERALITQTGHSVDEWPLVLVKELIDNALDACEEAGVAPEVSVIVRDNRITVADNGSGIPGDVLADVLDFNVRVSSREKYVAPDRGKQGNALMTVVCMPYVLDGKRGRVRIDSQNVRHEVAVSLDEIAGKPVFEHNQQVRNVKSGCRTTIFWPEYASQQVADCESQFLHLARSYSLCNPHLSLRLRLLGEDYEFAATNPGWQKWTPSSPTSAHWYGPVEFRQLVAAYVAHDRHAGEDRYVRDFIQQFRGLSGSAKQKAVLGACGLGRTKLSELADGNSVNEKITAALLKAMQKHTRPVKAAQLGIIGEDHVRQQFTQFGFDPDSFRYKRLASDDAHRPWVLEAAFDCHLDENVCRDEFAGVNWSAGIGNPLWRLSQFNTLGDVLADRGATFDSPTAIFLHVAAPGVEYRDKGKSSIVIEDDTE